MRGTWDVSINGLPQCQVWRVGPSLDVVYSSMVLPCTLEAGDSERQGPVVLLFSLFFTVSGPLWWTVPILFLSPGPSGWRPPSIPYLLHYTPSLTAATGGTRSEVHWGATGSNLITKSPKDRRVGVHGRCGLPCLDPRMLTYQALHPRFSSPKGVTTFQDGWCWLLVPPLRTP